MMISEGFVTGFSFRKGSCQQWKIKKNWGPRRSLLLSSFCFVFWPPNESAETSKIIEVFGLWPSSLWAAISRAKMEPRGTRNPWEINSEGLDERYTKNNAFQYRLLSFKWLQHGSYKLCFWKLRPLKVPIPLFPRAMFDFNWFVLDFGTFLLIDLLEVVCIYVFVSTFFAQQIKLSFLSEWRRGFQKW